jgi:hypothetical protein
VPKLLKVLRLRAVIPLLNGASGEIRGQEHGTRTAAFTIPIKIEVDPGGDVFKVERRKCYWSVSPLHLSLSKN